MAWLLVLGAPATAAAYCRTMTCDPMVSTCALEAGDSGCIREGVGLFWPLRCIGIALQKDASRQVNFSEFERVARAAFGAWNNVDCDGQPPSIQTDFVGSVTCDKQQFNEDWGNANILIFRDDRWPYHGQSSVLALTTLTFGVTSGTIYDADMEINAVPSLVALSTSDSNVKIDLQSILTHEAGHLLGLAHSSVDGATMVPMYVPGSTSFRDLSPDDRAGICAIYPPDRAGLPVCDFRGPTPRSQGFSELCGGEDKPPPEPEKEKGCSCHQAPSTSSIEGIGGLVAIAAYLFRRRSFYDRAT